MPDTTSQLKASVPLAYIETTIPSGTTIGEYRRSRPQRRSRWHWLRQSFRRDDRARHAISIGAIVVLTLLFVGSAEAHVYWTNNADTTIGRANLDGTAVNQSLISGGFNPCGVAVDGAHVYWGNVGAGTIGRANLDGSGVNQSFIGAATGACGVAVDAAHVYWSNGGAGTIGRADLDGTGVNQSFIGGATMPCGVAVDADPIGGVEEPGGGVGESGGGGGAITNPPPPVDTVAQVPTLGNIKVARRQRRLVARVPVSCPGGEAGGCRTTLRLATAKKIRRGKVPVPVVLGSKQVNVGPGHRSTVSIRLARGAAGFAQHGTLATRIRITSSDAAGNSAARSVTRRLRIPRR